jgi:hypothetical protein
MKKLIVAGVLGLTAITAQSADLKDPDLLKLVKEQQIKDAQFKIMLWKGQGLTVEMLNLSWSECRDIENDLSAKGKKVNLGGNPYNVFNNRAFSLGWYQNSNGDYVALNCVTVINPGSIVNDVATEMKLNVKVSTTADHLNKLIVDRKILEDKHNAEIEKNQKEKLKDLGLL